MDGRSEPTRDRRHLGQSGKIRDEQNRAGSLYVSGEARAGSTVVYAHASVVLLADWGTHTPSHHTLPYHTPHTTSRHELHWWLTVCVQLWSRGWIWWALSCSGVGMCTVGVSAVWKYCTLRSVSVHFVLFCVQGTIVLLFNKQCWNCMCGWKWYCCWRGDICWVWWFNNFRIYVSLFIFHLTVILLFEVPCTRIH